MSAEIATPAWPLPTRKKNELRLRQLRVQSKTQIGRFWRIVLGGEDLQGFNSHSFDDHIKLFFPEAENGELRLPQVGEQGVVWPEGQRPPSRDYTPLAWDAAARTLTIDFFMHPGGLASGWAQQAQINDPLIVGGPRGSFCMPLEYAFQLYLCDETGLPALNRRLTELQAAQSDAEIHLLIMADEAQSKAYLPALAQVNYHFLPAEADAARAALEQLTIPAQGYFLWLTGEGARVKSLIDYLTEQRQVNDSYLRGVAYWHSK
ncbi:siderophore-interacting protein [Mixta tenebrionis]|uniref:Siderophore-interacting protein n=1 Tax=Mixta tenebrionis TaxID=2562439 RepID=A0A506V7C4_9GAMM|nr:siderophore-interacting protein [Mixta tenebrionis]TPW41741.1 siderophore-interacting protein [Mixta tenebrionis]